MALRHVVAFASITVATIPSTGSAGADPPFVNHFKGRGAQATLTDCTLDLPPGAECVGVDVFVTDERYQERGSLFGLTGINVLVFDVVIDPSAPDGFVATPVAGGFLPDADVTVAHDFSRASARAIDLPLVECELTPEEFIVCSDVSAGSMTLEVQWRAIGKRQSDAFQFRDRDGSLGFSFRAIDASRPASASGLVDGDPFHEVPLFPPSIFGTNNGVWERTLD